MKREEKNVLARGRILQAALAEFSAKGYEGASLNTVCAENDISKGIIYHHFKDKDELYLLCVRACFDALTAYMQEKARALCGTTEERLRGYFDARLQFFAGQPLYLGIFTDAALDPPAHLCAAVAQSRNAFDALNIAILTGLLEHELLRKGLRVCDVAEDFRMYLDFFNTHFKAALRGGRSREAVLKEHEQKCHRQLDIWLHGVLEDPHGKI